MSTKFAVVSIGAEDVVANVHFYRDVLGLELLAHYGSRPHLEVDGKASRKASCCAAAGYPEQRR